MMQALIWVNGATTTGAFSNIDTKTFCKVTGCDAVILKLMAEAGIVVRKRNGINGFVYKWAGVAIKPSVCECLYENWKDYQTGAHEKRNSRAEAQARVLEAMRQREAQQLEIDQPVSLGDALDNIGKEFDAFGEATVGLERPREATLTLDGHPVPPPNNRPDPTPLKPKPELLCDEVRDNGKGGGRVMHYHHPVKRIGIIRKFFRWIW